MSACIWSHMPCLRTNWSSNVRNYIHRICLHVKTTLSLACGTLPDAPSFEGFDAPKFVSSVSFSSVFHVARAALNTPHRRRHHHYLPLLAATADIVRCCCCRCWPRKHVLSVHISGEIQSLAMYIYTDCHKPTIYSCHIYSCHIYSCCSMSAVV